MLMYERLPSEGKQPVRNSDDDDVDTVTTEPVSPVEMVDLSAGKDVRLEEFVDFKVPVASSTSIQPSFDTSFSRPRNSFELRVY
jgi:hypothetical protein